MHMHIAHVDHTCPFPQFRSPTNTLILTLLPLPPPPLSLSLSHVQTKPEGNVNMYEIRVKIQ